MLNVYVHKNTQTDYLSHTDIVLSTC